MVIREKMIGEVRPFVGKDVVKETRGVPGQYEKIVLPMDRFDFSAAGIKHYYLPDFLLG